MKQILLLLGFGVLAAMVALAQDAAGTGAATNSQDQSQTKTQPTTTRTNVIRGCLSGSTGNYTVTDPNGMQYQVSGDDATLRSMVGREVEITLSEDRSSEDSTQAGGTATHTSNAVQASNVRAVASSCKTHAGMANPAGNSASPSSAPDERPAPQMMSMLQQQSAPGQDNQSQNGSAPQVQSTPPVTSQTPATQASPTTGSENNQPATSPNAMPTSPNSATPSSNSQPPQSNANDANKPLYERQATDVPWANSSGRNASTPPSSH
jgi:hypothetical protein